MDFGEAVTREKEARRSEAKARAKGREGRQAKSRCATPTMQWGLS